MALDITHGLWLRMCQSCQFSQKKKKFPPLASVVFDMALLFPFLEAFWFQEDWVRLGKANFPHHPSRRAYTVGLIRSWLIYLWETWGPGLGVSGEDMPWGDPGCTTPGDSMRTPGTEWREMAPESLAARAWLRCWSWKPHPNSTDEKPTQPNE